MILLANFNSIKVQLRHYMGFLNTMSNIFQFHKGTIKTLNKLTSEKNKAISIP